MSTFLASHYKLQQLQSRLSKNQYLSSDCLPNHIDAQVFQTLKTSQSNQSPHSEIPQRSIYPSFYHWYILMSQFSSTSLHHWIQKKPSTSICDNTVAQAIQIIANQKTANSQSPLLFAQQIVDSDKYLRTPQNQTSNSPQTTSSQQMSNQNSSSCFITSAFLPKVSSQIEKKPKNQEESPQSFIMDIKLNSSISNGYENVKGIFECQSVKLESIKVISGNDVGYDVRVFFVTVQRACEEVKRAVLGCGNVEIIQCKKQKRNQSL